MPTTREPTFAAEFAGGGKFAASMTADATFTAQFAAGGGGGGAVPPYTGETRVTPGFEEITLATKNLRMQDDVVVEQIPITEVSNPAGGITFIIGG